MNLYQAAQVSLDAVLPLLILASGAAIVPILTALKERGRRLAPFVSLLVLAATGVTAWRSLPAADADPYHQFIRHDLFAVFGTELVVLGAIMVVLMSLRYVQAVEIDHPEYYGLMLFACCGMVVLAQASDLLVVFLGIEILSLSLYALTALQKSDDAVEAGFKYFLMGAFASAFYLMGAAFVFGAAGTTRFEGLREGLTSPLLPLGAALIMGTVAFKLAIPPFHMWAPDAYEGASSSVTAFMAFGTKAALFFTAGRFVASTAYGLEPGRFTTIVLWLSAIGMVWGNAVAIAQSHLRRLIAYSSVAHAATLLLVAAAGGVGVAAILFYLAAYTFTLIGFFTVLTALRRQGTEVVLLRDLGGLSRTSPLLASLLALFLLSLAGFPPTAGFLAKFLVFRAALMKGHLLVTVVGALASVIGVFYYLYIVVTMYMREAPEKTPATPVFSLSMAIALLLAFLGTLPLGLFPDRLIELTQQAIQSLPG